MQSTETPARETLPSSVRPKEYILHMNVALAEGTFSGSEHIVIDVLEPIREITLNAVDLEIAVAIVAQDGPEQVATMSEDKAKGQVTFAFPDALRPGTATLALRFSGKLNDSLVGFYKSEYEVGGVKKRLAVTQFEAADARRAFPCFDQPDMKAVFTVTMEVPSACTALSNGEIVSEKILENGRRLVSFASTPPMSTYIVAFAVGELECVERVAATGTTLRIWTTAGKAEQGRHALETTDRALSIMSEYFGVAYPLPKLDQIAVPDFAFGAMENWGLIVYREVLLLVSENSSKATRQGVDETICHELAHQWYGNLVTMFWWNDIWLNESFAVWLGTTVTHELYPEYDVWTQFANSEFGSGMRLDGMDNTHPIDVPVARAELLSEVFDHISYNKGGAVMRMLEAFLGKEAFRAGMRIYMRRHAYENASADDLWTALEESSGKPVREIMRAWTQEPGHPVLRVSSGRTHDNRRRPTLTQTRFCYGNICAARPDDAMTWPIPMTVRSDKGARSVLFEGKAAAMELPSSVAEGASFLHYNAGRTGFYRVHHDAASLAELLPAVAAQTLSTAERLGIEDDAYALCRAGMIPVTEYLRIASAYAGETDYSVWSNLLGNLAQLRRQFGSDRDVLRALDAFGLSLVSGITEQLGWEPSGEEPHTSALLRPMVLRFAGSCGDAGITLEAVDRFERALKDRNAVPADIRAAVYALTAQTADTGRFRDLQQLYRTADSSEEQHRLLAAMGSAGTLLLRNDALSYSLTDEVRTQDAHKVLANVSAASRGDRIAWDFVQAKWKLLTERYNGDGGLLIYFVTFATENLHQPGDADAVRKFFAEAKPSGLDRTIAQAIERVTHNAAWHKANRADLRSWSLRSHAAAAPVEARAGE